MKSYSHETLCVHESVGRALSNGRPVVALETAVATHGLPHPMHLEAMDRMQSEVEATGCVAAVCVVENGHIHVGADMEQVARVAASPKVEKVAGRDLASALVRGVPAGLTVSATLIAAETAGIRVFATGGIGGVHRGVEQTGDVSSDLYELSRRRVLTICAGAKSVLDIPRTLEMLESLGVPVQGYQTSDFPAFYLRSSGLPVPSLDSVQSVAQMARLHWAFASTGIVLGNALSEEESIADTEWASWLDESERRLAAGSVRGRDVTPFLLAVIAQLSEGRTVAVNMALLAHNARLAGEVAVALVS